ncbi:caspase family protein [Actinoplanes subglobosus]|uniref:Caspase family protein n=1 Tax=Actinoplanes subglobosus TaxID=1547892 RepID=A0ABV8J5G3_9ACTN
MNVLSSTFERPADSIMWWNRLRPYLQLEQTGTDPPRTALSYLTFTDGSAVVLHRSNNGRSGRSTYTHALIGPHETLTVEAAIGMDRWKGWLHEPPKQPMATPPAGLVQNAAARIERLQPDLSRLQAEVATLFLTLRAHPAAPLGILGCPADDHLALVSGLVQVTRLAGIDVPTWTFSTHEDPYRAVGPESPRLAFLTNLPIHGDRLLVDLARPPRPGPELDQAEQLIHAVLTGAPSPAETPTLPPSKTHKAICIGLSSFRPAAAPGEERGLSRWRDLPRVAERMQALVKAFNKLGYDARALSALTAQDLGAAVRKVIDDAADSDVVVIHLFSHGYLTPSGSLRVIGADGEHHEATDVGDWLKRIVDAESSVPMTLFLLDVCHGGSAARLFWQPAVNDETARSWVIAAAAPDEAAYAGRFTDAVIAVLDDLAAGRLDINRSFRYAPIDTIAQLIRREVLRRADAAGALAQQVTASRVDISANVPALPFFPNRQYADTRRHAARTRIDAAVAPFLDDLDEALDPMHFLARAAGHGVLTGDELSGCFSGRRRELRLLSPWLNLQDRVGLRIVTGSPGVGKSSLIGVLVCAAHPLLRDSTRAVWEAVEQAPYPNHTMAAVHARARTLAQIVASVARQLGLLTDVPEPTAGELIEALTTLPNPPVIILDALDEAVGAAQIMQELLLPLTRVARADGEPIRMLVGVRPWDEFEPLRAVAERDGSVLDLDKVEERVLNRDISAYVRSLLLTDPRWDHVEYVGGAETLARAVADTLTEGGSHREWGAFLVAGLFSGYVLHTFAEPIGERAKAIEVGRSAPRTLPDLLDLDLRTRATGSIWIRPILVAAAHGLGDGMPARLLGHVAAAFTAGDAPGAAVVLDALDTIRFYLRQSAEVDGTTVYRLFHQGLADHLKKSADAVAVVNGLLDSVHSWLPPSSPAAPIQRWDLVEPYVRRHIAEHAADAGRLGDLLNDADFLLTADPTTVLAALDRQPVENETTAAYRWAVAGGFEPAERAERAQRLALAATRHHAADLARALAAVSTGGAFGWHPLWVRPGTVSAISSSHQLVVIGTAEGAVDVLDLANGKPYWSENEAHASPVTAVTLGDVDGGPGVLSVDINGILLSRRLDSGRGTQTQTAGSAVRLDASAVVAGRTCAVLVHGSGRPTLWDIGTGTRMGELDIEFEDAECFAVAGTAGRLVRTADTTVMVQYANGEQTVLSHDARVDAATAGVVGDELILFTGDATGTIRAWDPGGGELSRFVVAGAIGGLHASDHGELVVQSGPEILGIRFAPNGLAVARPPVMVDTLEPATTFRLHRTQPAESLRWGPAVWRASGEAAPAV